MLTGAAVLCGQAGQANHQFGGGGTKMEIHRCAARRPGAETRTVVREREPEVVWDAASSRLILRAMDNPSWKDDGTYYNYEVFLTLADIERLRWVLAERGQPADADRPRD
jgi:hypothetical protein